MFGWIPIVGPIIDGIVSIFSKWQDTSLGKYRVDGTVDVEAMKTSAQIISDTRDDIGIRLTRDIIMFPIALWVGFVSWNNIVVYKYPYLVWTVAKYPPGLEFLPYTVFTFLFGVTAMKIWKR